MLENFQVFEQDLSAEALADYRQASALAIDTETMGLKPWRDRLCLVQICNPAGQVAVVRIARGQTGAPNLKQLLENEAIEKVFHFARFDVAMLQYHLEIATNPIFCTKIASKLARTYSPKHGLKDLINELEGVELDKRQQSSDWGNAVNLSVAQLEYASNDVRYLLSARQKLMAMLQREERWELAQQCFVALQTIVQLDLLQYENIFEH
ncbi:MAG: ribonuclease D [Limnothrix sp.]|uniref:ribonuclease D n=1 Tax=unclassified Limnothrix TaxID=2632864 RepID=UPI001680D6F1|nr:MULTISPECIES: ribonuclease D [unclassified Limnothrix]MEB3119344.1 ribonuclease D [Limnothrix sp.]MBD2160621.1 ribonuclease D [Limnothrix sp. FACHB-1083]MBD2191535.1 ribonuclease D [Limnothrix sp. FACHB-1088]MBD2554093.1 ribonuclease D [Limnothrix sp. FACHB-708]MBD2591809.1 ribonuclease D [Limnothrix sp. FACHB-406]